MKKINMNIYSQQKLAREEWEGEKGREIEGEGGWDKVKRP